MICVGQWAGVAQCEWEAAMDMQKRPPAIQTCSRFFQPEYDMVSSDIGEPIYTVYAPTQRHDAQLKIQSHDLQRFAIVWGASPQYYIFEIIERALVADLLSPICFFRLHGLVVSSFKGDHSCRRTTPRNLNHRCNTFF